jgi:hypothetical protein
MTTLFDDITEANRLISFGFQPGKIPARSIEYRTLVDRYRTDAQFAQIVQAALRGFDLSTVAVDRDAGIVLGTTAETVFAASVSAHVPTKRDRPLVLLAHLAIAAIAYPRAEDLEDEGRIARFTVAQVDEIVTAACQELDRRAAELDQDEGVPADQPELLQLWRAYLRRSAVGTTVGTGTQNSSRRALIKRAAEYLAENGMLRRANNEGEGTYTTTARYRIQVRELASQRMLGELAALGIAVGTDGSVSITTVAAPDPQQLPA